MTIGEAEELALSYRDKLTSINTDNRIYMYTPVYHSVESVFVTLSIRYSILRYAYQHFRFDSYNEAYAKPHDWYDIK